MSNYDVETRGGRAAKTTLLGILALAILIATSLGSLFIGIRYISLDDITLSFTNYDPNSIGQMIVQTLRLPRMIAGIVVGISFAVSGALMQGVTNNPMASPSILGINAGASFGLAVGMILFPYLTLNGSILFSFGGAALATLFILALAKRVGGKATPVYLALAGTAISAVFVAVTHMLVVYFQVAQELSFWTAGGISGIRMEQVLLVLPWTLIGILSGSAVALAGPIGFVGLVIPHITRKLVGIDYRLVIPFSALFGAVLVMIADVVARIVNPPFETPLGAITALVGVPFFIYLANRKGGK